MKGLEQDLELRADPAELPAAREFVTRWARRCGLDERAAFDAALVATEALTNAIRHAGGPDGGRRAIRLTCRDEAGDLVVEVADRGRFTTARPRAGDHGGRGLFLIRELTRAFDLEVRGEGTRLAMRLGGGGERPLSSVRAA